MRTSDYTIIVDLPANEGSLLVHGYTGAFDAVQPQVADYLRALRDGDANRPAVPDLSELTFATLRRRGYLTDLVPEQEQEHVIRLATLLQKKQQRRSAGFLIIPTYNCNLRCVYCYEQLLRCNGRAWLETRMTPEIVDAAYAAMRELTADAGNGRGKAISLYGGEPLLASNRELVEHIVARGRTEGYLFSAITNGVDLDHFLPLLGPAGIRQLQITLDGPPVMHDRRRVRADGAGSFEAIAANISAALPTGVVISLRMNVDRQNVAEIKALSQIIQERGWAQHKNFSAYSSPVHSRSRNDLQVTDLLTAYRCDLPAHPELYQVMDPARLLQRQLAGTLFTRGFPPFKPSFCGSNTGMYLFDPFGDLYPCWDVVGRPEFRTGRFYPNGLQVDPDALRPWLARTIAEIPECRRCPYALFCGGGCTVQAYHANGRFATPMCHDFQEQFTLALPALYRQHVAHAA
jgi:uncharacterized protein